MITPASFYLIAGLYLVASVIAYWLMGRHARILEKTAVKAPEHLDCSQAASLGQMASLRRAQRMMWFFTPITIGVAIVLGLLAT